MTCEGCPPFDPNAAGLLSCSTLDDFSNRDNAPGAGWDEASYRFPSLDHLDWTTVGTGNAWVTGGVGYLRMPAASSTTVSVTADAPAAYGDTAYFIDEPAPGSSIYFYTVRFRASAIAATSRFRLNDTKFECVVNLGTGVVTARREGSVDGTLTSSPLTFVVDTDYELTVHVYPAAVGVSITDPSLVYDGTTSTATNPISTFDTNPVLALVGTGGGEPGYTIGFTRIGLEPCERPLAEAGNWSGYRGDQTLEASTMGGATTIIDGPNYASSSAFALWDSFVQAEGTQEIEYRNWQSYLVPPGAQYVRLVGEIVAEHTITWLGYAGPDLETIVEYEMGPVALDPDVDPTDFDLIGTGLSGTLTFTLDAYPLVPQVPVAIDANLTGIGAAYDAGDGIAWHLFQLGMRNVSIDGFANHTYFAHPSEPDGDVIEVLPRFPDNPEWIFTPYFDFSRVESGFTLDVIVWAYGTHGGTPVAGPLTYQPVEADFIGVGDGVTTVFTTRYPYLAGSLMVDVAGLLAEYDSTDPALGTFTALPAPPLGAPIYATYRAA